MYINKYALRILFIHSLTILKVNGLYKIGVGRADCTGPAGDIVFMGYAKTNQRGCGIHLRQFSRAFIFDDGIKRAAFVTADAGMMAHGVRQAVLSRLKRLYKEVYSESNLILSGTHTHSGPGGFLMHFMYDLPCYGFVKQTFEALVAGITKSIVRAHENMVEGKVYLSSGELLGANINRSPMSYLLNPAEERAKYKYDVDKEMVQLKLIRSSDNSVLGAINWFAVHPTSMNNTNCLITSDNVGYASLLLEKLINNDSLSGTGAFVGAFASTNLGDVSPNIKGPRCINTGEECDFNTSSCNGEAQFCIAAGPGRDMFESTKIIAEKLFGEAKRLLSKDSFEIKGPIKHVLKYVDMPKERANITLPNGQIQLVHGCLPAMGYSFAAGTTDGPGEFDFTQGTLSTKTHWDMVRDLLFKPTPDDVACQHPKPILLNTGRISTPYEWQPRIVSTQIIQVGQVLLAAVPGEFTTMSGRRLRDAVKEVIVKNGGSNQTKCIITGLSNDYTSYIATPQEYQMQRYEGASTIFGPHTLTLYVKIYRELAEALSKGEEVNLGPKPPDLSSKLISLVPGVLFDSAGFTENFGDCHQQPSKTYRRGDVVRAKFRAGHPRNDLMTGKTFLTVEKLVNEKEWRIVATDADWETKFIWKKTSKLVGGSEAVIEWEIPPETPSGTYRIRHFGVAKPIFRDKTPYSGTTNSFQVL